MQYIERFEGVQKELLEHLHDHLLKFPGMSARLNYGIPFYYRRSWVCYINPLKNVSVELVFIKATQLGDEHRLLDFRGRKMVAGIQFESINQIPWPQLSAMIREALLLDDLR